MAISDKIQQVMKERGISYAELSRITGIAPSSMQSYGSGRSKKIPFHVIETLSEKLHLPIEFWLGDEQIAETRVSHELAEEIRNPSTERNRFMSELKELRDMYEKGLLTDEEFQLGKKFLFEMTK